ncbi:DnaB-like helicase C-terminal domain-containing protein [Humibacter sp.]|uniref:DnaB-like helicase C-terminal domain-containing protein n=1 Tax=Humibacter sp. TaxID=1940291 RepID=UPI003F80CCE8
MVEVDLAPVHPAVTTANQISAAITHLDRHPDSLVRWPFPDLDAMTGPMGEGEVWFVPAFSGGGKTTFIASAIEAWRQEGKRIYVMPLELQAPRFRTYLACMQTGTHPGDALSGALRADPSRADERERLKKALLSQGHPGYGDRVMVSEQRAINVAGLQSGLMEAKSFQADVVIVDHIDHIEGDDAANLYAASKQVNHAALRMAQDNGLLLVFTSQLNMEIAKTDRLAKYQAPMVHHVQFPSVKLQIATGMIGLFRPLRAPRPDESPDDYKAAIKAARAGTTDAPDALEPNTMGVVAMKLRNYGSREGKRINLAVEHGKVTHLPEKDRYQTHYGARQP